MATINVEAQLIKLVDKIVKEMCAGLASDKIDSLASGQFYTEHGTDYDLRACALGCLMHHRGLKPNLFSFDSAHALWTVDFPGMEHWMVRFTYPAHEHDPEILFLFPQLSNIISKTNDTLVRAFPDSQVLDEIEKSLRQWITEHHKQVVTCPIS